MDLLALLSVLEIGVVLQSRFNKAIRCVLLQTSIDIRNRIYWSSTQLAISKHAKELQLYAADLYSANVTALIITKFHLLFGNRPMIVRKSDYIKLPGFLNLRSLRLKDTKLGNNWWVPLTGLHTLELLDCHCKSHIYQFTQLTNLRSLTLQEESERQLDMRHMQFTTVKISRFGSQSGPLFPITVQNLHLTSECSYSGPIEDNLPDLTNLTDLTIRSYSKSLGARVVPSTPGLTRLVAHGVHPQLPPEKVFTLLEFDNHGKLSADYLYNPNLESLTKLGTFDPLTKVYPFCTSLIELYYSGNQDLALDAYSELRILEAKFGYLRHCPTNITELTITDDGFSGGDNLRKLCLGDCSDVSGPMRFTNLTELSVETLSRLPTLPQLTKLYINSCPVSYNDLSGLRDLKVCNVDMHNIFGLTNLTKLQLYDNLDQASVDCIATYANLTDLKLDGMVMKNADLSCWSNLVNLEHVGFSDEEISQAMLRHWGYPQYLIPITDYNA